MVKWKRPAASLRIESTGPWRDSLTECAMTQVPASGTESRPWRWTMRPLRMMGAASWMALRSKLAEVFGVELGEVFLQRLGIERGGIGRGFDQRLGRQIEQVPAGEDRRLEPQRYGDAVRGPGIDLDHVLGPVDVQLGEVGVLLDHGDEHP